MPRKSYENTSLKSMVPKEIMTNLKELVLNRPDTEFLEFIEKWEIPSYEFGLLSSLDLKSIFIRFDRFFEKIFQDPLMDTLAACQNWQNSQAQNPEPTKVELPPITEKGEAINETLLCRI
jgi:hypothetical protein